MNRFATMPVILNYTRTIIRAFLVGLMINMFSVQAQENAVINASQSVPFSKSRNVTKLAKELTGHLRNEEDKALAVYTWVIHNIKYDVDQMTLSKVKEQSIQKTLRSRKGVCMHYAQLLNELYLEAGIKCEKIDGNVDRDLWAHVHSSAYHVSDHSWNGIQINGVWQLVDATFDAGYVSTRERKLAALLKRVLGIPYVRYKLAFIQEPTYHRYNMVPDEMIIDHLPDAPFWQLLHVPMSIDTFRLTMTEKKRYMRSRPKTRSFFNFEEKINQYRFDEYSAQLLGLSNLEFSDTNYFSFGFGQENYVQLNLNKYNDTKVEDLEDCLIRYDEYDTLFYFIDTSKSAFKRQSKVEKIVHNGLNKEEKRRYKLIFKQNTDVINRTNTFIKKDVKYILKHKKARKKTIDKIEKLTATCNKLKEMQLRTKTSEEIVSRAEVDMALTSFVNTEKKLQQLFTANDSINSFLHAIEKKLSPLALRVQDALIEQANNTAEAESWLIQFYSKFDSIYFESRKRAKMYDTIHRIKRDSLFGLLIKNRNEYINSGYRNIVEMKKLIKANQAVYTEMSPFIDVDDMGESIQTNNQKIIEYYLAQIEWYNQIVNQNTAINGWLKTDMKNQKQLKVNYIWEKRTESARRKANHRFERSRHLYRSRELYRHQSILSDYKILIRNKLKEIKIEAKNREKLEN